MTALAMAIVLVGAPVTDPFLDPHVGRDGDISHMGNGYPANYLAIPLGPGVRVKLCGPARCKTMVSTDAGPNRASLLNGRIADVSPGTFRYLCDCDPWLAGLISGSWRVVGAEAPQFSLPPTDTLPVPLTPLWDSRWHR